MDRLPPHELNRLEAVAGPDNPLDELVARRLDGEPLQYIEGSAPFGPLDLIVDPRVLVPRPETEGLYEIATKIVRNPEVIVDLCTGSGALGLALKRHFPSAAVFATDISEEAIEVATENRYRNGLEIYLAVGDLFDPLPASLLGQVDLLVVNPPYVSEDDFDRLPEDVRREPRIALVAGRSGLEVIREIGESAASWMRPGGVIVCEIWESQGAAAAGSFIGLHAVIRKDLSGRDRYVVAVKP